MKRLSKAGLFLAPLALTLSLGVGSLAAQDTAMTPVTFTVQIENVSGSNTQMYSTIGIDGVPVGAAARRPAMPGEAFEFTVKAAPGDHLSFASMYGQSNDSFFGFGDDGVALYDDAGNPVSGDVSSQVVTWDAGTEVNEPLGTGANQGPRQSGPDAGTPENGTVEVQSDPDFPKGPDALHVTLTPEDGGLFLVHIDNMTASAKVPTPISPLLYVVHTADQHAPLWTTGQADRGLGLERIAESGNPEILGAAVAGSAVMNVGLSPGVFIIHDDMHLAPVFTTGQKDRGEGLEAQAEDGNPVPLSMGLDGMSFKQVGVFNTAVGADKAGPLMPGQAFEFTFQAVPGDRLTFTEMFGQSNDLFFAPDENGIALFGGMKPISGTFSGAIKLWDAGTEVNQEPFVGADQAARQSAPNTGAAENGVVQSITTVTDGFTYPSVLASLKLTITNDSNTVMNMMAMTAADTMMMTPEAMMQDNSMMATPEATMGS
ncbi:MAG: spondin domain-containing protein [Chloroflexota bacterium]